MVFCAVAALVAGLLIFLPPSDDDHRPATRSIAHREPFNRALANLAAARGLRYKDTSADGSQSRDITVSQGGNLYGTTGSATDPQDVLRVDGKTYTKGNATSSDAGDGPRQDEGRRWTVGAPQDAVSTGALDRFTSPGELAAQLWIALDRTDSLPDPDDPRSTPESVDGVPALRADTPAGSLLVAKDAPYRVLRLEPHRSSGGQPSGARSQFTLYAPASGARSQFSLYTPASSGPSQVSTGPLPGTDSAGVDLAPLSDEQADRMYDALETGTRQLADAVDAGVTFTLDTDGNISCGSSGCSVHQQFTGTLTTDARTRLTGGSVTASMDASIAIDGQDAGTCSSSRRSFPITGRTVTGTLSCSAPGAGPIYAAVDAKYRAQAEAESQASGGQPVPYSFPYTARTLVDAAALATAEVDRLVGQVRQDRQGGDCRTTGARGTSVVAPLAGGRAALPAVFVTAARSAPGCAGLPAGVTVSRDDGSITISHPESGSMALALLDRQGKLTLGIDRLKGSTISGKQMFQMIMKHFGDRVRSIEGNWSYGDNLAAFNKAVADGVPLKSAARQTWTGKRAAEYGFTGVRITRAIPAADGGYAAVSALYRRP